MNEVPEWLKWAAGIGAPILAWFGKDWWVWWTARKAEQIKHDDKIVERRSTRIDNEIDRVLKLKDERIEDLKLTLSGKNTELASLLTEVRNCRHEKDEFAKQIGEKSVALAETRAQLVAAQADIAQQDSMIEHYKQDIAQRERRIEQLEGLQSTARDALTKMSPPTLYQSDTQTAGAPGGTGTPGQ